jgi:outer membrane immunogenic protein
MLLALFAAGRPAIAQDAYDPLSAFGFAPPPVINSWNGSYIGAQLGYGWGNGEIDDLAGAGTTFDPFVPEWSTDGIFGGAYVGFNWQAGNWVFGVEGDINSSGIAGSDFVGGAGIGGDIAWFASLRGRVGWSLGRTLLYGTAGWAYADASHNQDASGDISSGFSGWTIGGGLEYLYSQNILLRAEYRYYDFGDEQLAMPPTFTDRLYQTDLQTISVGVAYKF